MYNRKYKELNQYLSNNFVLEEDSIHGPKHWEKVLNNSMLISDMNKDVDRDIVILFSIIHD